MPSILPLETRRLETSQDREGAARPNTMLSSQHSGLCVSASPAVQCRRRASSPRTRIVRRRRRRPGVDEGSDNVEEEPTSPHAITTTSTVSRRPAAAAAAGGLISSPSNPFVKHCVKLRQNASYRRSCGCALVVGLTPIREISYRHQESIAHDGAGEPCVDCLLLLDGAEAAPGTACLLDELGLCGGDDSSSSGAGGAQVFRVSHVVMKKLAGLQSTDSTEAVAVMRIPKSFHDVGSRRGETASCDSWFSSPPHRLLVLDGIQDPGNLGTLMRSAMAFKWAE